MPDLSSWRAKQTKESDSQDMIWFDVEYIVCIAIKREEMRVKWWIWFVLGKMNLHTCPHASKRVSIQIQAIVVLINSITPIISFDVHTFTCCIVVQRRVVIVFNSIICLYRLHSKFSFWIAACSLSVFTLYLPAWFCIINISFQFERMLFTSLTPQQFVWADTFDAWSNIKR